MQFFCVTNTSKANFLCVATDAHAARHLAWKRGHLRQAAGEVADLTTWGTTDPVVPERERLSLKHLLDAGREGELVKRVAGTDADWVFIDTETGEAYDAYGNRGEYAAHLGFATVSDPATLAQLRASMNTTAGR